MSVRLTRREERIRRARAILILLAIAAATVGAITLAMAATPPTGQVVTVTT